MSENYTLSIDPVNGTLCFNANQQASVMDVLSGVAFASGASFAYGEAESKRKMPDGAKTQIRSETGYDDTKNLWADVAGEDGCVKAYFRMMADIVDVSVIENGGVRRRSLLFLSATVLPRKQSCVTMMSSLWNRAFPSVLPSICWIMEPDMVVLCTTRSLTVA